MRVSRLVFAAALVAAAACSDPPEPELHNPGSVVVPPAEVPLTWTAPGGWSVSETSTTNARRSGYKVPKAGDDKEDAELLVLYFGRGPNGERDVQWDSWFGQYDGDAKGTAERAAFKTETGFDVETFEFLGDYKLNIGNYKPGMKKSPVQMVKKGFRMVGAVVKTKDRGNWFFRLVGPDETVKGAREPFLEMLKGVK